MLSVRIGMLSLLLIAPGVRGGAQAVLSPVRYEIGVAVDYEADMLRGTVRLVLENRSSRAERQVSLLLYRLLRVGTVRDAQGRALRFTQRVVGFTDFGQLQVNQIVVTMPRPLAPGQRMTLRLDYSGYLLGYAETGMAYVQDRIDTSFTILRDDAWAFPRPGLPSIASLRGTPPWSYSYAVGITVPRGLTVVNGGRLDGVDTLPNGLTFRFSNLRPVDRMDFAIARYRKLSAGVLRIFFLPGDEEGAAGVARAGSAALDLLSQWFGPPGTASALTFIEVPDGWGSQSDGPTIIQAAAAFRDPQRHREVYHELSHMWNVPSTDRPSPRWEEGLASFLEYLVAEKISGVAAVDGHANQVMTRLRRELPANPSWRQAPLVEYGRKGSTDLSYRVGALFFDLLYRLGGQDAFNRIVRTYASDFGARGGSTRDLVQVINQVSATSMTRLIDDWILTTRWTDRIQAFPDLQALVAHYRSAPPNP